MVYPKVSLQVDTTLQTLLKRVKRQSLRTFYNLLETSYCLHHLFNSIVAQIYKK